ncbi:MAG: hypothetical protein ACFFAV_10025 [Candidatus Hermodarchaeota archaeon]
MLRKGSEFLLGLFFSDDKTIVYDDIKLSYELTKETNRKLKTMALKFLGPLFMTRNLYNQKGWKIDYIETSLTPQMRMAVDDTLMQSFTCLSSTKKTAEFITNLFSFIGSPYTEDLAMIYERLDKYIHPSIIQGKFISQTIQGANFKFDSFIEDELRRGIDLIEHTLGSPRKIYWEKKLSYSVVGVIKRTKQNRIYESDLYAFDIDDVLRKEALEHIPSYYFMGILPDYYEQMMNDTLSLFGKNGLNSNIIKIKISNPEKVVLYIEEFMTEANNKTSYGLILIPSNEKIKEARDLSFYKKNLRYVLNKNKAFESAVIELNSRINPFESWNLNSDESLKNVERYLDSK